jgi:hypothetical protein
MRFYAPIPPDFHEGRLKSGHTIGRRRLIYGDIVILKAQHGSDCKPIDWFVDAHSVGMTQSGPYIVLYTPSLGWMWRDEDSIEIPRHDN